MPSPSFPSATRRQITARLVEALAGGASGGALGWQTGDLAYKPTEGPIGIHDAEGRLYTRGLSEQEKKERRKVQLRWAAGGAAAGAVSGVALSKIRRLLLNRQEAATLARTKKSLIDPISANRPEEGGWNDARLRVAANERAALDGLAQQTSARRDELPWGGYPYAQEGFGWVHYPRPDGSEIKIPLKDTRLVGSVAARYGVDNIAWAEFNGQHMPVQVHPDFWRARIGAEMLGKTKKSAAVLTAFRDELKAIQGA